MTDGATPLKVAILGARGIGQVHARVFQEHGANVCAVLGTTQHSAEATCAELATSLGIHAKPFFQLDRLLAEPLDAVSICTPPTLHFEHLQAVLDAKLPAFCEKPLFWEEGITLPAVVAKLDVVGGHPHRRIFVNTSNAAFIDAVRSLLPARPEITRFDFRFWTRGPYRGAPIAVDLMPHALSLLLRLFGPRAITGYGADWNETRYACRFNYGDCAVELDLQEGGEPNELSFAVNGREFRRVQEGRGRTYRVHLLDVETNEKIGVEDPFATYIARFLGSVRGESASWEGEWTEAAANLRLMAQVLTAGTENSPQR